MKDWAGKSRNSPMPSKQSGSKGDNQMGLRKQQLSVGVEDTGVKNSRINEMVREGFATWLLSEAIEDSDGKEAKKLSGAEGIQTMVRSIAKANGLKSADTQRVEYYVYRVFAQAIDLCGFQGGEKRTLNESGKLTWIKGSLPAPTSNFAKEMKANIATRVDPKLNKMVDANGVDASEEDEEDED